MMRIEAPLVGGPTRSCVLLRLAGKPHDGNLAVGLLLVCAIAWGDRRDAGECLGPLLALEGLTADLEPLGADLQPDVAGIFGHVEEPGWVACRSAKRGDYQPGVLSVCKTSDRRGPHLARLGAAGRQKDDGKTHLRAAPRASGPAVPTDEQGIHGLEELDERFRHPRPAGARWADMNGHLYYLQVLDERCTDFSPTYTHAVASRRDSRTHGDLRGSRDCGFTRPRRRELEAFL